MTPQQIENMRKVMFGMFGQVALMMPDSEVIAFRDEIQRRAGELPSTADDTNESEENEQ